MRTSSEGARWALLSMREAFDGIEEIPHTEEAALGSARSAAQVQAPRLSRVWDSDGKMDLFAKRSVYLRDCYYTHFLNAGIAAAADFPVYKRERRLDQVQICSKRQAF